MIIWISIGVVLYLLIGVSLLIWAVKSDPWGGLLLEVWWLVLLIWPLLLIRSLFVR
jgi:hypothetical protein